MSTIIKVMLLAFLLSFISTPYLLSETFEDDGTVVSPAFDHEEDQDIAEEKEPAITEPVNTNSLDYNSDNWINYNDDNWTEEVNQRDNWANLNDNHDYDAYSNQNYGGMGDDDGPDEDEDHYDPDE